jgi:hypothetical protein
MDAKILWELAAFIFSMHSELRSRIYPPTWWCAPPGLHIVTAMQATVESIHDHPLYFVFPDLLVAVRETSYGIQG